MLNSRHLMEVMASSGCFFNSCFGRLESYKDMEKDLLVTTGKMKEMQGEKSAAGYLATQAARGALVKE